MTENKPGPDPKYGTVRNVPKRVNVSAEDSVKIDQLRGQMPVSEWIYRLIRKALDARHALAQEEQS